MSKAILLLTQNSKKKEAISAMCKSFDIELKEIWPGNINLPIGTFLGMPLNSKSSKVAPVLFNPPELLIFNGLSDKELDIFLDKYKDEDIDPIQYKGVITPHNITWSPYEFILEYEKEAEGR